MIIVALGSLLSLSSQLPPERYGWIVRNGADTVSVERVTRRPTELLAEVSVPGRARLRVIATTDAHGCVTGADVAVFPWGSAPEATPLQRVEVHLSGDSVHVAAEAGDVSRRGTFPAPGARVVLPGESFAASALVVECALSSGTDSVDLPAMAFPNLRAMTVRVRRRGASVIVVTSDTSRVTLDDAGRPVRVAIGRGGLVLERVALEHATADAAGAPDYSAPPGATYTAHAVQVPVAEGIVLAGTLTRPRTRSGRVPAVVTVSGSGPQDRDGYADIADGWRPFRQIAASLADRGIAVLRLDDRGVGASTGDHAAGTELTAADDVRAALAYLRGQPDIDPARLVVLGHSEGARIAMLVAADDTTLAGLVLLSGAADTRAAVRAQALWAMEHRTGAPPFSRDSLLALVDRQMDSLAVTGRREVFRWDAAAIAEHIHVPVGIFHGATDRQVPAEQADALAAVFRRAGSTDVTVHVFPDVNHLLVHDGDGDFLRYDRLERADVAAEVLAAIGGWLAGRLGSQ